MGNTMLKWSHLFNMPEIDFEGSFPMRVSVEDNIQITLAWLTGAGRDSRKLLRCDALGSLLSSDPWNGFNPVEKEEFGVTNDNTVIKTFTEPNVGILVSSGANLVSVGFIRIAGGASEGVYVPAYSYYWFPHSVYQVAMAPVPIATGGAATHGATGYN